MLEVLACVPQTQQVDSRIHYLVAHFVMAYLDSANIPWFKLLQSFANSWVGQQRGRGNGSCGSRLIYRC